MLSRRFTKDDVRQQLREQRLAMRDVDVKIKSYNILENFVADIPVASFSTAFVYANFQNEVITGGIMLYLFEQGVRVAVPKVISPGTSLMRAFEIRDVIDDLEKGTFDVREPREACKQIGENEIDLVIIPGIAFDENGNRIGFGKGYYDRFLKKNKKAFRVALAYDYQVLRGVPTTKSDERVDAIITESATTILHHERMPS